MCMGEELKTLIRLRNYKAGGTLGERTRVFLFSFYDDPFLVDGIFRYVVVIPLCHNIKMLCIEINPRYSYFAHYIFYVCSSFTVSPQMLQNDK